MMPRLLPADLDPVDLDSAAVDGEGQMGAVGVDRDGVAARRGADRDLLDRLAGQSLQRPGHVAGSLALRSAPTRSEEQVGERALGVRTVAPVDGFGLECQLQ